MKNKLIDDLYKLFLIADEFELTTTPNEQTIEYDLNKIIISEFADEYLNGRIRN